VVTKSIQRLGRWIKADEVFEARTSGDLDRTVRALPLKTNPIDRYFLLQSIVKESYKQRREPRMRRLCLEVGRAHLNEFAGISRALAADMAGTLPTVPSFKRLATALDEDGLIDDAISVCEAADRFS
jgi:hypothetical protein